MHCPRCATKMIVVEPFRFQAEILTAVEPYDQELHRCIACGHYSDTTVRLNRAAQIFPKGRGRHAA